MGPSLPIHGRGASHNPPNRFDTLAVEREDWVQAEDPSPRTTFYRDATKDVISTNDSPDVGFDVGINAYRGCEHGCVYCLAPGTPVLHSDLAWRPIGDIHEGDELVGFDEFPAPGRTRKLRKSRVEAVWWSRKPTYRVVSERTEVITTADHRWLQVRNFRWSRTDQLAPGRALRHLAVDAPEPVDEDYRVGYLAGLSLGDGTFRLEPGWRSAREGFPTAYWRVALKDGEPLRRAKRFLASAGVEVERRPFDGGPSCTSSMEKVETRSRGKLERLHPLLTVERSTRSYRRGFLAGFFDAEGHNGTSLRISQVDLRVLERVRAYARTLGFEMRLEVREDHASNLRLVGSVADRLRFLSIVQPAIRRKVDALFGRMPPTTPDPIVAIEPGPVMDVVDIQTSTGTFYAAGLATHNCFARPYHEYLGFSAGLDFETKIVVKEDAPALLRKRLASPRWEPKPLMMSGATDPYQPAERRFRITRGILEVLADFRHPVGIITKNHLVTRDVDLLAELARHEAVVVMLSVTSLRNELQRVMEPRTSVPRRRLDATRTLSEAGVPVGAMVGPVIPGLTDHELPAILEAAAEAGATRASYVLLRLPHGVAPLFERWLEQHFPDRKEKVLNRLRDLHDGRLYDSSYHHRARGGGAFADQIRAMFDVAARKAGLDRPSPPLSTAAFRRPEDPKGQMELML